MNCTESKCFPKTFLYYVMEDKKKIHNRLDLTIK